MAMEINSGYSSYANRYTNSVTSQNQTTEKTNTTKETIKTSNVPQKTAADELSYLSKKFSNCSFIAADYSVGMKYGSNSTTNIAISSEFLSKMANDPQLESEYEGYIEDLQRFDKAFAAQQAAMGWRVVDSGWAIDKDGNFSGWCIVTKDPNAKSYLQKLSEKQEEINQKKTEKKEKQEEIEENRQTNIEEEAQLQERMEEAGKEQFGDRWKGVVVVSREDENAAIPKAYKDNEEVTGLSMNIKV